ncbi:MAG TPA: hypothetical protein VFN43_07965, partial [Humibacillus sp.]|nr:hypothetical protein [Humibacillus sp.]
MTAQPAEPVATADTDAAVAGATGAIDAAAAASAPETAAAVSASASTAAVAALLNEAMTKSGLLWIDVAGDRAWPAWHVWDDGAAYVVSGPGEQPLPWLPEEVRVILRSKDTGGRLLTLRAHTHVLEPGTPEWGKAADLLRASRLNAVDDSLTRWADACTLHALVPFDAPLEAPGAYAAGDARSAPARTAATTTSWRPWHWRGRGEEKAARKRARAAERAARQAARERARLRAKR